ncbi:hypothetical protein AA309_01535 [Microvirga vignae]|uniref:Cadherin domain-containing protein n=1 Tax=Microvirga vignae TaxID=1225564 RepID=A0A0H1RI62_9HYPH|nr:cadherin domain-containing protein [Microvirga vignae]KLK94905.1 hypothetical protein AA309_01535 [Microvirga vignae]
MNKPVFENVIGEKIDIGNVLEDTLSGGAAEAVVKDRQAQSQAAADMTRAPVFDLAQDPTEGRRSVQAFQADETNRGGKIQESPDPSDVRTSNVETTNVEASSDEVELTDVSSISSTAETTSIFDAAAASDLEQADSAPRGDESPAASSSTSSATVDEPVVTAAPPPPGGEPEEDPPTNISFAGPTTIQENSYATGASLGGLSATDASGPITYAVSGGNGAFGARKIGATNNWELYVIDASKLNYEAYPTHQFTVNVSATDSWGNTGVQTFTFTLTDASEAPTNLGLSATSINEKAPEHTVVGNLTGQSNEGGALVWEFIDFAGGDAFRIVNNGTSNAYLEVRNPAALNYENGTGSYTFQMRARSADGAAYAYKAFTLAINDQAENPSNLRLTASTVSENAQPGERIASIVIEDDYADLPNLEYTITGQGAEYFEIDYSSSIRGLKIKQGVDIDFATLQFISLTVTVRDPNTNASVSNGFGLFVQDDNEAPTITVAPWTETTNASVFDQVVKPFTGVSLADPDGLDSPNSPQTQILKISFAQLRGDLVNAAAATGMSVDPSTGIKTYTFQGTASQLQAVLRDIGFDPADDMPGTTNFTLSLKDVFHATVTNTQINVVAVANHQPTLTIFPWDEIVYASDDGPAVNAFDGVLVGDAENDSLTLTISFLDDQGVLGNTGDVDGVLSTDGLTRTFTFSGNATDLQTILSQLTWNQTDGVLSNTRFHMTLSDGITPTVTNDVLQVAINVAPTIAVEPGTEITQAVDNGPRVSPFRGIDFSDREDDFLTVTISFALDHGVLYVPSNTHYTVVNGIRTYTFEGKASDLDSLVRQLTFDPKNGVANTTSFHITVTDHKHETVLNDQITVVTSTSDSGTNAAPTITVAPGTEITSATDTGPAVSPFTGVSLHDAENDILTVTVSFNSVDGALLNSPVQGVGGANGIITYTYAGTASDVQQILHDLTFNPTDGVANTTNFTITVKDPLHQATSNNEISVITTVSGGGGGSNTAPTITVAPGTAVSNATDNGPAVYPFRGVDLADADNDTLTVTISFLDDRGVLGNAETGTSTVANGVRTFTFTGKADWLDAVLHNLTFDPTDGSAAAGNVTTNFTITVKDPLHQAIGNNQIQVVTSHGDSGNLAPSISVAIGAETTNATDTGPAVSPFTGVDLWDNENDTLTMTVSFRDADGALGNTGAATGISVLNGVRTYTFTGKADVLETTVRGLTFNPTDGVANTTTFTIGLQDSEHAPVTDTRIKVVTAVAGGGTNTAPTITVAAGTKVTDVEDTDLALPFRGVDLFDAENDDLTVTISFLNANGALQLAPASGVTVIDNGVLNGVRSFTFKGKADALEAALQQSTLFDPADGVVAQTNFTVTVKDALHQPVTNQEIIVRTSVGDAPNAPTWTNGQTSVSIDENTTILPVSVVATDPNGDAVTYSFVAEQGNNNNLFRIDRDTGEITLAPNTVLDYEAKPVLNIYVKAIDADGLEGPVQKLTINLNNIDEAPSTPLAEGGAIFENELGFAGSVADSVDPEGWGVTYEWASDVPQALRDLFHINAETGVITAVVGLNREANDGLIINDATGTYYLLKVVARDGIGIMVSEPAVVRVDVLDVNEAPDLSTANATVSISETAANGDVLATFTVADPDANELFVYEISGVPAWAQGAFAVDAVNKKIIVADKSKLAVTQNETFTLTLTVKDKNGGTGFRSDTQTFTVTINDANEAPTFRVNGPASFTTAAVGGRSKAFAGIELNDAEPNDTLTFTIAYNSGDGFLGWFNVPGVTGSGPVTTPDGGKLVYTFTGTASLLNSFLDNVFFNPTDRPDGAPDLATKFTFTVKDPGHTASSYSDAIEVVSVTTNAAPTFQVNGPTSFTTAANDGVANPFAGIVLNDANPADVLTFTITYDDGAGSLNIPTPPNGVTASGPVTTPDGGKLVYTFTGTASLLNDYLDNVAFDPTDRPEGQADQHIKFSFSLKDDLHAATSHDNAIEVVSVTTNAAPTFQVNGPTSFTTVAVGGVSKAFAGIVLNDSNPDDLLTFTIAYDDGDGYLDLPAPPDGVTTGGPDIQGSKLVYTFTGTASALNSYLDNVGFDPTDRPNGEPDVTISFTFTLKDELHNEVSYPDRIQVVSKAVDDLGPDEITLLGDTISENVGRGTAVGELSIHDPENDGIAAVSIEDNPFFTVRKDADGAWRVLVNGVINFEDIPAERRTPDGKGWYDLKVKAMDDKGVWGPEDTIRIYVEDQPDPENQAPVISVNGPTSWEIKDTETVALFKHLSFSDAEEGDTGTLWVQIFFDPSQGDMILPPASQFPGVTIWQRPDDPASPEYSPGQLVISGVRAGLDAFIHSVAFDPKNRPDHPGDVASTDFTIYLNDSTFTSPAIEHVTVAAEASGNASNDPAPVITVGKKVWDTTDWAEQTVKPFSEAVLTDNDSTLTLKISFHKDDGTLNVPLGTPESYDPATGKITYTFTGNAAFLTQLLHNLEFDATNRDAPSSTPIETLFTISLDDGHHAFPTTNEQVKVVTTVTGPNIVVPGDITLTGAPVAENGGSQVVGTLGAADPDSPITGFTLVDTDGPFEIQQQGNDWVVVATGDLNYEGAPHHDTTSGESWYEVTVTAQSGSQTSASQVVKVYVTDVNEAPTALSVGALATVRVGDLAGALVVDVDAADPDTLNPAFQNNVFKFKWADNSLHDTSEDGFFKIDADGKVKLAADVTAEGDHSFTVVAYMEGDEAHYVSSQAYTVTVQPEGSNVAPTLSIAPGTKTTQATDNGMAVYPFRGVDLSDAENDDLTLTISFAVAAGVLGGTIVTGELSQDGQTITYRFENMKADALDAILRQLSFNPNNDSAASGPVDTPFTITVTDNQAGHTPVSDQVVVHTTSGDDTGNAAPVLAIAPGTETTAATSDGPAVYPFRGVDIADADNDVLTLTISFEAAEGELGGGAVASTVTNGIRTYVFTGTADTLDLMLRGLTFNPTNGVANTTPFTITVQDSTHAPVTGQVTVDTTVGDSGSNAAPTIDVASGTEATSATSDGLAVYPFRGVDIADADNDVLTLTISFETNEGQLSGTGLPTTSTVTNGIRTYVLTGTADQLDAILRGLSFDPADGAANTTPFTISVQDSTHAPVTRQVTVETSAGGAGTTNAAPTIAIADDSTDATDNGPAVRPFLTVDLSDAENDILTLTISFTDSHGVLGNTNGNLGTVSGDVRTFVFTGTADALDALLRGLTFDPAPDLAAAGQVTTTFTIAVQDSTHAAVTDTVSVVTHHGNGTETGSGNDPLDVTLTPNFVDENLANRVVGTLAAIDPDVGDTFTYEIVGDEAGGRFVIAADGISLKTVGGLDWESTDPLLKTDFFGKYYEVAVRATDSYTRSLTKTLKVYVTDTADDPSNVTPTIGGADNPTSFPVGDNQVVSPFGSVTFTDPDSANITVTIALDTASEGFFENLGIGTYDAQTGVYTVTGLVADVQNAVQHLKFHTADRPNDPAGTLLTTNFSITVSDGNSSVRNTNISVVSEAVDGGGNQAPGPIVFQGGVISVLEHLGTGLTVGFLQETDADGDHLTYTLVEDGGGRIDLVNGNEIVVKNHTKIDFEQMAVPEFSFTVLVSDGVNPAVERTVTLGVENRILERITGTAGDDQIWAGSGNDTLNGAGGNDTLSGGTGRDQLSGGAGADVFLFNSRLSTTNWDLIDFKLADNDRIWLKQSIFTALGTSSVNQPLDPNAFALLDGTITDQTRIIYDQTTGDIYYDANGSAAGQRVKFAQIAGSTHPLIGAEHFFVV